MTNQYLAFDRIGMIKYYECAKIYFLHEKQLRPEWARWLKFKKKKLHRNSCPSLYFVLIYEPSKFPFDFSLLKYMEPEIVESYRQKRKKSKSNFTKNNRIEVEAELEEFRGKNAQEKHGITTPSVNREYASDLDREELKNPLDKSKCWLEKSAFLTNGARKFEFLKGF